MKRFRVLVVAALLAVVASGCIKADLGVKVNEDGSGTFSALIAVNSNFASTLGGLGGNAPGTTVPADFCKGLVDDAKSDESLPDGAKVEPYRDGDFCGVRVSTPFKTLDEALDLLGSSSDTGSGESSLSDVVLEKTNNGFRFSANWEAGDTADTGGDAFAQQFLKGFSYIVRIKLPGGQVENNADRIDGDGTMIWNLDPLKSTKLSARTELGKPVITNKVLTDAGKNVSASAGGSGGGDDGGSSKTWLWIVLGLVVIAGAVAFVLLRKNKAKGAPPSPGLPGVPVGVGAPVGAPPAPMGAAPMGAPAPAPAPVAPAPAPAPAAPPAPAPVAPAPAPPVAAPAPTEPAADATMVTGVDAPQWDAARNAYIQYDRAGGRWMQFDQASQAWKPIE